VEFCVLGPLRVRGDDGAPPPSARATVQRYVVRLRRQQGPAAGACLTTKPSGYLMDVGEELDLHREECGRFAEARLTVTELWAEAALRARRAGDVVPELSRLCPPTSTASERR
jgi:DNA-binding SARP family transcriptional activator